MVQGDIESCWGKINRKGIEISELQKILQYWRIRVYV